MGLTFVDFALLTFDLVLKLRFLIEVEVSEALDKLLETGVLTEEALCTGALLEDLGVFL